MAVAIRFFSDTSASAGMEGVGAQADLGASKSYQCLPSRRLLAGDG